MLDEENKMIGNDIPMDEGESNKRDRVLHEREPTAETDLSTPIRRFSREGRGTGGTLARAQRISEQMDFTPKKRPLVNEELFSGSENGGVGLVRQFATYLSLHLLIFIQRKRKKARSETDEMSCDDDDNLLVSSSSRPCLLF